MDRVVEADVVVVGGGPAGISAALASGRLGAKTILIERYGFLGGMSTIALVYPWMTFHTEKGEQVIKGIAQEIVDRLQEKGGSPGHLQDTVGFVSTVTPYHPEIYKLVAVEMLKEAGVKLFVHSFVDQVKVEGTEITSVTLTSKSGKYEIKAKVFVDATGDADIAHLSGASTSKGRDADGLTQPMTMKFRMRGVDLEQVKQYMLDHPEEFYHKTPFAQLPSIPLTGVQGFYTHWKMSGVPINRDQVLFFTGPESDEVLINCTRVQGLDGTDVEDLTEAEEEGRRQVIFMSEFLKNKLPGFAKASISAVGTQIGIRETRRIVGEYSLTIEDVVTGRRFPDVIARSGYPVDIHDPSGKGVVAADIEGEGAYDIPYRCLIPQSIDNLLAAGRCISTTHEALATTRLTPSCMATGQAAGTAAAIAFHDKNIPRLIHVAKLQEQLRLANAVLD
ncbi:FAD-dependent oxidoreductase [Brevibacillus porteri]|uniref:FAD-dependent oxidoreductase n=1 Tax=Brevibacillus porteri TaxID=2126350 RepID=A0ABX5FLZ2_9BACL|nr:FAD-dependent oxidoreductase [Brevibacillus porteri]MED1802800.1 FAD-dependent oxidoreductase [Brevibacillus porteri]MED2131599.1 FAD-dependent oxidoreductase [Brevibacillus porteri]MED2746165.1 FAD-dependent oxidoreductase [Brevibacillus porteri]MED2817082.1 FAD-dependent oxidoreductase [Brevibacillus porteri]MED2892373.1 FAD-dependent oxidoreductase [Brevibacillus porteri]